MRIEHLESSKRYVLHWRKVLNAKNLRSYVSQELVDQELVESLKQRKVMTYIKKYLRKYILC